MSFRTLSAETAALPAADLELLDRKIQEGLDLFASMPTHLGGTLLASLIISVIVSCTDDPISAWATVRDTVNQGVPHAAAIDDTEGEA